MSCSLPVRGGLSDTKPATDKIQAIAYQVKSQLEEKEKKEYSILKAVEYKSQVSRGRTTSSRFKLETMTSYTFERMKVSHKNNKPLALHGYQTNKTRQDELK